MKTSKFTIILFILAGLVVSCEKSEDDFNIESIADTRWKLIKITDKSGTTSDFPSGIADFEIVFRKNGKINLSNLCNYSCGNYKIKPNDSIKILNLGPATKRYCLPDVRMDWEIQFISGLFHAETYTILKNRLVIHSRNYTLIFNFIDNYDSSLGKVLFCTNSHIMNCPFEIEIAVDGEKAGTLDARSFYSDIDCYCKNSADIGLVIPLEKGAHSYSAKELKCSAVNATGSWSGNFSIAEDSCTVIFLDVTKD
jgi:heat shock protein HslJ